jgi:hypothetical protein
MNDKTLGETKTNQKTFDHPQLLKALEDAFDLFDRAMCPFLAVGETGKLMKENRMLEGENLELGVRKNDLTEYARSTIKQFVPDVQFLNEELWYKFNDVPVIVKIFQKDYEFLKNPDHVWYLNEVYNIPNPFDKYYKARFILK